MRPKRFVLLMIFLLVTLTLPLSSATPYWAKPGVYIEYAALRYEPYIQHQASAGTSPELVRTAFLTYLHNGTLYRIYAYNDTHIRFRILDEKDGYLTVGVRIEMKNVTVKVSVPSGENLSPIWEQSEVIKVEAPHTPTGSKVREYKVHLRSLSIVGVYRIRESDGAVFSVNGTYYGHTFLWIDPDATPKENGTFVVIPSLNWTMKVKGVSSRDEATKTYYGEFGPPVSTLSLIGPPLVMEGVVEFTTETWGYIRYDPATGMVLSPTTLSVLISPDLSAVGIPFAAFTDERVAYDYEVNRNYVWAGLLPLYDTNAEFQVGEEVPFSRPGTKLKYVFYGSLALFGLAVVLNLWRVRRYEDKRT